MNENGPWAFTLTPLLCSTYMWILGQVMNLNCLTWYFSLTLAKQAHLAQYFPLTHPPTLHFHLLHRQLGQSCHCKGEVMLQHELHIFIICGIKTTKRGLWVLGKRLVMWGTKILWYLPSDLHKNRKLCFQAQGNGDGLSSNQRCP